MSMSKKALAVVGLLGSSTGFAASVTVQITENSFTANDGLVNVGDFITVNVFGSGFPDTVGATLKLSFNGAAVAVRQPTLTNGIVLGAGSPFTGGIATPTSAGSFPVLGNFSVLAPTVGALPTGNFGGNAAFTINFVAIGLGLANIQIVDDGLDFSWTDATTFEAIPVTYTNTLSPQVIPVPAAAWLFGSALGLLGVARRRFA